MQDFPTNTIALAIFAGWWTIEPPLLLLLLFGRLTIADPPAGTPSITWKSRKEPFMVSLWTKNSIFFTNIHKAFSIKNRQK